MTDFVEHPIFGLPKFGCGPGLYRVESLISLLGLKDYLYATPRIAVAGTNGKGSTAKFAAEILRRMHWRTGLFTSPHLYSFNERIEIEGFPASDETLEDAAGEVMTAVRAYENQNPGDVIGAFEAFFALALVGFARQEADVLILEAGIGGRYDPVRMARAPLATVTSVDFDHCELLGNTLIEIASDKVEIAASGGVVVLGPSLTPLTERLRTHTSLLGVSAVPLDAIVKIVRGQGGVRRGELSFTYDGRSSERTSDDEFSGDRPSGDEISGEGLTVDGVRLGLAGQHQVENFAIAGVLVKRLLEAKGAFNSGSFARAVRAAAAETYWPGRLELVHRAPSITIDVGHSPKAIQAALATFAEANDLAGILLVLGCSRDKDARGMVESLAPFFSRILCTSAHHKGLPASEIARLARDMNPRANIEAVEPIDAAASRALEICEAEGRAAYVAGGLFLAI